ncbi:MAG: hypothetical protein KJ057_03975 [Phycisphaerae bacterium]|nr:MAG: hypothetical protein EDS66_09445 [Planctomycetota bacterium]KAB2946527.1 MAG: hypothetical protein F9K17_08275 [Phycisphaerae bacterium]MBE7455401.1 hypothetical protein [Planctomycetia bacterium]MCK6464999.1 hypothetical protein [Phycisphaerae bacterium]MCL4717613.1 hypothetical protein [Phycisphaerae bacterium]
MIETHDLDLMMGDDWRQSMPPVCLECGYDLTGSVSDRCPECGIYFSRRELSEYINSLKLELRVLRSVNDWIKAGFWLALIALACLVLGWVVGRMYVPLISPLGRLMACVFALPGFCLSLSVIRVYRLPAWSRQWLTAPIRFDLATGGILMSFLAGVGAFFLP